MSLPEIPDPLNLLVAEEIFRQLRLRDIGGIIVIDFIDMDNKANMAKVYERMHQLMKQDRARHNILPLSKFYVMEITTAPPTPIRRRGVRSVRRSPPVAHRGGR